MPAIYSLADCGSTRSTNKILKNNQPKAAMVKGLISQLTTKVNSKPLGRRPTSLTAEKSICTIIGKIIIQISTATTILTWANSQPAIWVNIGGKTLPTAIPKIVAKPTDKEK